MDELNNQILNFKFNINFFIYKSLIYSLTKIIVLVNNCFD